MCSQIISSVGRTLFPFDIEDAVWTDEHYQETFKKAGLETVEKYKPLAKKNDPSRWVNETKIAPWVIYVLKREQCRDYSDTQSHFS